MLSGSRRRWSEYLRKWTALQGRGLWGGQGVGGDEIAGARVRRERGVVLLEGYRGSGRGRGAEVKGWRDHKGSQREHKGSRRVAGAKKECWTECLKKWTALLGKGLGGNDEGWGEQGGKGKGVCEGHEVRMVLESEERGPGEAAKGFGRARKGVHERQQKGSRGGRKGASLVLVRATHTVWLLRRGMCSRRLCQMRACTPTAVQCPDFCTPAARQGPGFLHTYCCPMPRPPARPVSEQRLVHGGQDRRLDNAVPTFPP
eukprot:211515-Chlamydomonas_euryale.AAC.1